jgi:hypothetical protein
VVVSSEKAREFETFADGCVGRHHARTARIGDDGDAVAARQRLVGEQLRGVEHVVDRTATDDPGLFEHPVAHVGTGGQRTGVGLGSRGTGCGSPALDGQNRLGIIWIARDRPRRLHQFAPAGDALQVHENDRGFGIVRQVVQQVHLVHVGLVAQADELAEADVFALGIVEDRGTQCPALGDECDAPFSRHGPGEAGVELHARFAVDHPQAVRADDPHARFRRQGLHPFLAFKTRRTDLAKAGGDDDGRLDALLDTLGEGFFAYRSRENQHGEIDRIGNVQHVIIGPDARDVALLRGDGIDRAVEPAVDQVGEDVVRHRAGRVGDAQHRHRPGAEDRVDAGMRLGLNFRFHREGIHREVPFDRGLCVLRRASVIRPTRCRPPRQASQIAAGFSPRGQAQQPKHEHHQSAATPNNWQRNSTVHGPTSHCDRPTPAAARTAVPRVARTTGCAVVRGQSSRLSIPNTLERRSGDPVYLVTNVLRARATWALRSSAVSS